MWLLYFTILRSNFMSYIDRLIANCKEAKESQAIDEFIVNDLSKIKNIDKAIYIIRQIEGDPEETFKKLSEFKKKKERACPALNSPSKVLYVGSSTTGVYKRIKQHIGDGPKGTYALHLSHWFEGKYDITIKLYDKTREVIQIIEDDLSDKLKPAFGKRGGNNK